MKLSTRLCAQLGLAAAFVVLSASVSALLLVPRYSKPVRAADVGTVAPSFELHGFNLAEARGQVVVLFFSALNDPRLTQCYDRIDRLARHYADDQRVKILGINIPAGEFDAQLAAHSFPTLIDNKANVAARYSATETPLMVVIDPNGVVRYRGPVDNPDLAAPSNSFLEEAIRNLAEGATLASAK